MTTSQDIDARCAAIARCAELDARYMRAPGFLLVGESHDDYAQTIIGRANRIIALRTQESANTDGDLYPQHPVIML